MNSNSTDSVTRRRPGPNGKSGFTLLCLFLLLVVPSVHSAMLNVVFSPLPAGSAVNLSAEGTLDWIHWGLAAPADVNRLKGVVPAVSTFTVVGLAPLEETNAFRVACSWTNGTPTLEASNTSNAAHLSGRR